MKQSQDIIKKELNKKGFKATEQRIAILGIFEGIHIPLRAEDVKKKLKTKSIDLATIYRTLASFEEKGIVKRIDLHGTSIYFELNDDHHHHIVCTSCGLIEDFEDCNVEKMTEKVVKSSRKFSTIGEHSLELFGLCKTCVR